MNRVFVLDGRLFSVALPELEDILFLFSLFPPFFFLGNALLRWRNKKCSTVNSLMMNSVMELSLCDLT